LPDLIVAATIKRRALFDKGRKKLLRLLHSRGQISLVAAGKDRRDNRQHNATESHFTNRRHHARSILNSKKILKDRIREKAKTNRRQNDLTAE
jgi:hypothetical protein